MFVFKPESFANLTNQIAMPKQTKYIHSNYLGKAFGVSGRKTLIRDIVKVLKPFKDEFDAIAFSGMSGALVAPIVADRLGKPFFLIRKKDESPHMEHRVEGDYNAKRYIIIDDFICTGKTVGRIQYWMNHTVEDCKYVGMLSYNRMYSYLNAKNPKNIRQLLEESREFHYNLNDE